MTKRALITGVVGQDGSYLAELLLDKGYMVRGITRRASYPHTQRIDHLFSRYDDRDPKSQFRVTYADMTDASSLENVLSDFQPNEVYNLAAQSHVGISFDTAESTLDINAIGPFRLLDTIRRMGAKDVRFYQASSSEMFGASPPPQHELTPFLPQSPYGVSKVAAFYLTRLHRIAYGMFASNGILFNHESPRRGLNFVTRKITLSISQIVAGELDRIQLGNLDAKRDWGFSGDYVEGIWRILQHGEADDFVLATGEMYTVRDFLAKSFGFLGLDWEDFVTVTDRFLRPAEVPALLGDSSKARRVLGWKPMVTFDQLCLMMLESDLAAKGFTLEEARARAQTLTQRRRGG
jgi:GDPmannose 4,6-dehydratase